MKYFIFAILMFSILTNANANAFCDGVLRQADVEQGYINKSKPIFEVASQGRLHFYSAPNSKCLIKNLFLVRGDKVIGYSEYEGFLFAAYFKKNGDSVDGWLELDQLKNTDFSNGPSEEEQMVFNMAPKIIVDNKLSSLDEKCFTYDINNNEDEYYKIIVFRAGNMNCMNGEKFPFTIIIKKKTLESYTNQGMKEDEFRNLHIDLRRSDS